MSAENKIWTCKIGEVDVAKLREVHPGSGADGPMRDAVEGAYKELTGEEPTFTFSGWGGELNEAERATVEDRLPSATMLTRLEGKVYCADLFPHEFAEVTLSVHEGAELASVAVRLPDGSYDSREVAIRPDGDLLTTMMQETRRAVAERTAAALNDPTRIPDSPGPHA